MNIEILNGFLTGSHAYGTPNENSDIDFCVLVNDVQFFWTNSMEKGIRFGKLNLIAFSSIEKYMRWKDVTNSLIARKPVTRDEAIEAFKAAGFTPADYSLRVNK